MSAEPVPGYNDPMIPQPEEAYKEIDGLRVFNKEVGPVGKEEIERMSFDAGAQLHLLRHFSALPSEYREHMVGQEYQTFDRAAGKEVTKTITAEDLENALQTAGSKFHENIPGLETPEQVLELVKAEAMKRAEAGELTWFDGGFAKKTMFAIDLERPIGRDGVVAFDDLSPEQQANAQAAAEARGKLNGDDFKVNMAHGVQSPEASKLAVILGWINGKDTPVVFTAYPGELAPDFPRDGQSDAEKKYNADFWNRHAFVK